MAVNTIISSTAHIDILIIVLTGHAPDDALVCQRLRGFEGVAYVLTVSCAGSEDDTIQQDRSEVMTHHRHCHACIVFDEV